MLVKEGEEVAEVAARVAREWGTTYVPMGRPRPRRRRARFAEPLTMRLIRALPDVDVRIVSDRAPEMDAD